VKKVAKNASPALKDVVSSMVYDNQGRMSISYNPFEATTNTGVYVATIPANTPFTLAEYYASPLNRTWKVTPPSWYATTTEFGTNASNEVKINAGSTYYQPNTLYKTTITDPDGKTSISYKDRKGRTVMVRSSNTVNATPAETYTIYDEQDRVSQVVPPGATVGSGLCFKYLYDVSDNMISKTVPDAGTTTMVYNERDQLILSRDPVLLGLGQWRASRYDDYGRVLRSGIYNGTTAPTVPISLTLEPTTPYLINIWDGNGTVAQEKGRLTTAKALVLDGNTTTPTWLENTFTYDVHGRVISSNGNNHLNTTVGSETSSISGGYDWADHIISDTRVHKQNTTAADNRTTVQGYTYDRRGRLKSNTFQVNKGTTIGTVNTISELNYDWKNQLIEKNIGKSGTLPFLQSLDYTYNDQGWLTKLNNSNLAGTNTAFSSCMANTLLSSAFTSGILDDNDLFYFELTYNDLQSGLSGTQKNGNISKMTWRTRGRERQSYNMTYDHLNLMKTSTYSNINDAGTAFNNVGAFNETLDYDIRGNITTLQRTSKYRATATPTCWSDGTIDNLTYTNSDAANSNKIMKIADVATDPTAKIQGFNFGAGTTSSMYEYDANGNMRKDPYKGLEIAYEPFLNLPKTFTFATGNNTITMVYDAMGKKLTKLVKNGTTLLYRMDYIGGFEYSTTPSLARRLESIYHSEGRVFNTNVSAALGTLEALRYEYTLKDHLGNTRITFTDKDNNGKVYVLSTASNEIIQENHYYPFGLNMNGPWLNDATALDNKYQYNGKELNEDFGLNLSDYGARWYDAAVGKWWSVVDS
jgi:Domain of unknown function (DUF6443)